MQALGLPSSADAERRTRSRQQEVVTDLGQQALETDDLDQLMHDASAAVDETPQDSSPLSVRSTVASKSGVSLSTVSAV